MKVVKFGGKSINTAERMKAATALVAAHTDDTQIIVLSPVSGTQAWLREMTDALHHNRRSQAKSTLKKLETFYRDFISNLLSPADTKSKALAALDEYIAFLQFASKLSYSEPLAKDIMAHGVQMSTTLMSACMTAQGMEHAVLPAIDFMQTDKFGEPLIGSIKVKLTQLLNQHPDKKIFVTQGSLCRNAQGETDNLGNGGSDYTAASIAAAMAANVCEIWSDIPAASQNNIAVVHEAKPIAALSFDESAELAYFSEKVLHPASMWPARHYGIPVQLLNITQPQLPGTMVTNTTGSYGAKVIAARDGITVINVKSSRMLMAYGFLQRILQVFEKYKTAVDMVTTSEVAVSLTIDTTEHLPQLVKELEAFGVVSFEENQTIVSVVGNEILQTTGFMAALFAAVAHIPLSIASYGASRHNVSLLMSAANKGEALKCLHTLLPAETDAVS